MIGAFGLQEEVVERQDDGGRFLHPNLQRQLGKVGGYHVWLRHHNFDISQHVTLAPVHYQGRLLTSRNIQVTRTLYSNVLLQLLLVVPSTVSSMSLTCPVPTGVRERGGESTTAQRSAALACDPHNDVRWREWRRGRDLGGGTSTPPAGVLAFAA